jgi:hypothetical protein
MNRFRWSKEDRGIVDTDGNLYRVSMDMTDPVVNIPIDRASATTVAELCELGSNVLPGLNNFVELWLRFSEGGVDSSEPSVVILVERGKEIYFSGHVEGGIPYDEDHCLTILKGSFTRIGATPVHVNFDMRYWDFGLHLGNRNITIGEFYGCVFDAGRYLSVASRDSSLDDQPFDLLDRIRAGEFEALIGMREKEWLEFKSYIDLDRVANKDKVSGKIELSEHVGRFANSERGGILIVGIRTEKVNGVDAAEKLALIKGDDGLGRRYQNIIDQHVYPSVRGMEIEWIERDGLGVMIVIIPPQMENEKPFLVHGAIDGSYFSILRRRGEDSIHITAPEIHALIAAGYQLMRGRRP